MNQSKLEIPHWRQCLRERALSVARAGNAAVSSTPSPVDREILRREFGAMADDALAIVEAYARGAPSSAGPDASSRPEFVFRLDLLLNMLSELRSGESEEAGRNGAAPPQMIQSELWQVLRKVRESAELSYSREVDLIELDRRILMMLQALGPLPPAEISSAVGVDKAQVSRSVKRLLELGMAERDQLRSPLRLTAKGRAIGRRLLRLAELRNRELIFDIGDEELESFYSTIETLLDRAVLLYEQERDLAGNVENKAEGPGKLASRKTEEKIVIDRSRIVSPMMTLSSYFNRSGALAFKRRTGLSSFEAFVMSEIGMNPPIEWAALVTALQRDHSQAGRTVKALMDRGLVERTGKPGRRHGRFAPTKEGGKLYDIITSTGRERSVFLLAPLADEQRTRFLATFDKVRRNASAQLERERAFAEIERSEATAP